MNFDLSWKPKLWFNGLTVLWFGSVLVSRFLNGSVWTLSNRAELNHCRFGHLNWLVPCLCPLHLLFRTLVRFPPMTRMSIVVEPWGGSFMELIEKVATPPIPPWIYRVKWTNVLLSQLISLITKCVCLSSWRSFRGVRVCTSCPL